VAIFYFSNSYCTLHFYLTNFVIPHSNLIRMDFEDKYYHPSTRKASVEKFTDRTEKMYISTWNHTIPLISGDVILQSRNLMIQES